jgi:hypothetical protein
MSYLAEQLSNWTDIDVAAWHLAISLGLMQPPRPDAQAFDFGGRKDLFWTRNPIGDLMFRLLDDLHDLGAVEAHPEDDHLLRWSPAYQSPDL